MASRTSCSKTCCHTGRARKDRRPRSQQARFFYQFTLANTGDSDVGNNERTERKQRQMENNYIERRPVPCRDQKWRCVGKSTRQLPNDEPRRITYPSSSIFYQGQGGGMAQ